MFFLEVILGALFAVVVLYFYGSGADRNLKSFFAGTLTLAALIYVGFAVYGLVVGTASTSWLIVELVGLGAYFSFAYIGFRKTASFLALGWLLHVFWDLGLHYSEGVLFVPKFYPSMCLGFDLVFAVYIFYRFYLRYRE